MLKSVAVSLLLAMCFQAALSYSRIRFIHTSPDAPAVSVNLDNEPLFLLVTPQSDPTSYAIVSTPGDHLLTVFAANEIIYNANITLLDHNDYTIAAIGFANESNTNSSIELSIVPYVDDIKAPYVDKSLVRFIHAAPGIETVNIFANNSAIFNNVAYSNATNYLEVNAGFYNITAKLRNGGQLVLAVPFTLTSLSVVTIFVEIINKSLEVVVGRDATYTGFRFAHASPEISVVNVTINGTLAFKNVNFSNTPTYISVQTGYISINVSTNATSFVNGTVLTNEYNKTAIVTGLDKTLYYLDNFIAPSNDSALLRVIHASPNSPEVNVVAKPSGSSSELVLFQNISYSAASDYIYVTAGKYDITIRPSSNSSNSVFSQTFSLQKSVVYTVIAEGVLGSSFTLVASVDYAPPSSEESGLSTGAIIGIIVACVVGGLLIIGIVVYFFFRKRSAYESVS